MPLEPELKEYNHSLVHEMKFRNFLIGAAILFALAFITYKLYEIYNQPDNAGGKIISELIYPDVNGLPLALSSLKGNIVLIQFWAAWCAPCRMENPVLVSLYNKYHRAAFNKASGFDVYSISLDNNRNLWTRAIEMDQLPWRNNVSTLEGWNSDAATRFGIRSIPANILIDENGMVIGNNLSPQQIGKILKNRMK